MFIRRLSEGALVIGAPAKINLFLEVLNKRSDGYHDINSAFQAVSLFDTIRMERTDGQDVIIELTDSGGVPTDGRNLIARAFNAMKEQFGLSGGLRVALSKKIPVEAGLGGGSSDCAATIMGVNVLFKLGLTKEEMTAIGAKLGSDVPFFFTQGQALVTGRGDVLEPVELPTDYWLVLVTPDFGISTAESYARLKIDLTNHKNPFKLRRCVRVEELIESIVLSGNDFSGAHALSYPVLGGIEVELRKHGAVLARLTGSGPTVFGIFMRAPDIEENGFFERGDWQVNTVRPITLPIIDDLQ
jgi:4-diphosphocytidyl-2-C-methyl-D-erythritol kinase